VAAPSKRSDAADGASRGGGVKSRPYDGLEPAYTAASVSSGVSSPETSRSSAASDLCVRARST